MSLFESLASGNRQQRQPQITAQQAFSQLRNDPVGTLNQIGLNIPAGMNNPQEITQYLMQTGQVPQSKFAQVGQMLGQIMSQITGRQ